MHTTRKKIIRAVALAGVGVLIAAGCGDDSGGSAAATTAGSSATTGAGAAATTAPANSDPYKVSLLDDVTGTLAVSFKPAVAGFQSYINMINDQGGVNGRKINVDVLDGQSSPDVGLTNAQKAISSNPTAILQMGSSATAARVAPVVTGAKIPFLSGSAADAVVYPAQPNMYQVGMTATQQGGLIGDFIKKELGAKIQGAKIDYAAGNSPYIDAVIKQSTATLTAAGAKIGDTERFAFGTPSFAAQAGKIVQDNPAAVVVLAPANDAINVSTALTQAGSKVMQVAFNSSAAGVVFQKLQNPLYFAPTENTLPESNPELLAAAEKYGLKADVAASYFSTAGWVMASILVEGLKQCGASCTSATLGAALDKVNKFEVPLGVSYGTVTYTPTDHISADTARFHTWDAATKKIIELDPIPLQSAG